MSESSKSKLIKKFTKILKARPSLLDEKVLKDRKFSVALTRLHSDIKEESDESGSKEEDEDDDQVDEEDEKEEEDGNSANTFESESLSDDESSSSGKLTREQI